MLDIVRQIGTDIQTDAPARTPARMPDKLMHHGKLSVQRKFILIDIKFAFEYTVAVRRNSDIG